VQLAGIFDSDAPTILPAALGYGWPISGTLLAALGYGTGRFGVRHWPISGTLLAALGYGFSAGIFRNHLITRTFGIRFRRLTLNSANFIEQQQQGVVLFFLKE
jgi:hypothetical protein